MRFRFTHIKTLYASLAGGPLAVTGPPATVGSAFGQGRHLVLVKLTGCTGPTSTHNRYIAVRYSDAQNKKMIYIKIHKS
jgi:hypothetical protein